MLVVELGNDSLMHSSLVVDVLRLLHLGPIAAPKFFSKHFLMKEQRWLLAAAPSDAWVGGSTRLSEIWPGKFMYTMSIVLLPLVGPVQTEEKVLNRRLGG